jgi:hypothetical protein
MSALPALLKRIEDLNKVLLALDDAMGRECEFLLMGHPPSPGKIDLLHKDMAVIREQIRVRAETAERVGRAEEAKLWEAIRAEERC